MSLRKGEIYYYNHTLEPFMVTAFDKTQVEIVDAELNRFIITRRALKENYRKKAE